MEKHKGISPAELVKKHIEDKTHVITDEELQNVTVGEDAVDEEELEKEIEEKQEEMDIEPDKEISSPYDILDI